MTHTDNFLLSDHRAVVIGDKIYSIPESAPLVELRRFQLRIALELEYLETACNVRPFLSESVAISEDVPSAEVVNSPTPEYPINEEVVVEDVPEEVATTEDSKVSEEAAGHSDLHTYVESVVSQIPLELEVHKELGSPAPTPSDEYTDSLPQVLEFLRPMLTAVTKAGATENAVSMLIQSAIDAKDLGQLDQWKQLALPGLTKNIESGRDMNEAIPAMKNALAKRFDKRYEAMSDEIKAVLKAVGAHVPAGHIGRWNNWVGEAMDSGKTRFFVQAWSETEAAMARQACTSPVYLFQKIVDDHNDNMLAEKARAPIPIAFEQAVPWLKPWLPEYDSAAIDQETVLIDGTVPFAKRTNNVSRVEAGYCALRKGTTIDGHGAAVDSVVYAWTSPECPEMHAAWMEYMSEGYKRDGKRYAFTQQQFDVNAAAYFQELLEKPFAEKWLETFADEIQKNPRIANIVTAAKRAKDAVHH